MHVGDFALLRPPENSMRPAVARVHAFLKQPSGGGAIRVQWFYRAEDLSERPRTATGEDELFETMHYDDVQLVALVGRAEVGAYDVWEKRAFAARGGKKLEPEALADAYPGDERTGGEGDTAKKDDDAASVASDASSFFWDNYSASAVEYYCRAMYDPNAHLFVPSRFEDPSGDPEEELAALREGAAADARDGDFAGVFGPIDASDDEFVGEADEGGLREEVADLKRKRAGRPRSAHPRRDRSTERATQFALPADIGEAETLPCRDDEKKRVRGFLEKAIEGSAKGVDAGARCLYVSGVPGTGKTATIREVLRTLRARMSTGVLPAFDVVEVNGMSLPDANFVYTELLATMTGNTRVSPAQAAALLEKRFASGGKKSGISRGGSVSARERGKCVVLLLDEMDVLVSRTQKVLYDVLDWPTRPGSNLVVIGVANTMDLPERMLPRLASRLGLNRLSYAPYTRVQLIEILGMRLGGLHPGVEFDESTVKLCAAKVGAVSGDVRRALELCRRAVEIARERHEKAAGKTAAGEAEGDVVVKPGDLTAAVADMSGASRLGALAELSLFETLAVVAAIALVRAHGSFAMEETSSVQAVCEKAAELARDNKEMFECGLPRSEEIEECIMRLSGMRILLLERSSMLRNSRVIINLLVDDCCFALREDALAQKVLGM